MPEQWYAAHAARSPLSAGGLGVVGLDGDWVWLGLAGCWCALGLGGSEILIAWGINDWEKKPPSAKALGG